MTGWRHLHGRITETVAVTRDGGGDDGVEDGDGASYNVAAMGVRQEREEKSIQGDGSAAAGGRGSQGGVDDAGSRVFVRLWEGSDTLDNVRATGEVVVNFTRDPVVYVEAALGDADGRVVDGRLRDADAWIRCTVEKEGVERDGDVHRWRLHERETTVETRRVHAVNRGFNAVVEAAVDATRLEFQPELRERVERNLGLAYRCGGKREREAVERLREHLD